MPESEVVLADGWARLARAVSTSPDILSNVARPGSPTELAEGYDYWAQVLTFALRREFHYGDSRHPMFHRCGLDTKIGFDNPDNVYEVAKIDPGRTYRVVGTRGTSLFLEFSVSVGFPGVVMPVRTISKLDSTEIEIGEDGKISLTVGGPPQPTNWLALDPDATSVLVRQVFGEWRDDDVAGDFRILVDDDWDGEPAPPLEPMELAGRLHKAAQFVETQTRYWIEYVEGLRQRIAPNTFEAPGVQGQSLVNLNAARAFFCWGIWEVEIGQALIVETEAPPDGAYLGFHLCNYWLQSLDFVGRITSLNNYQAQVDPDGRIRYVLAHGDPGAPNWLDVTGHPWGPMVFRTALTTYAARPTTRLVSLEEVRRSLPPETPYVDEARRRAQIRGRRAHVASRFRW